jgi:hypothetical protein
LEKLSQREKEVSAAEEDMLKTVARAAATKLTPLFLGRGTTGINMVINEMTEKDCRDILARSLIGRLGCSHDNQPYVLPICLAYERDYFYIFSTFG